MGKDGGGDSRDLSKSTLVGDGKDHGASDLASIRWLANASEEE